jgi:hypothetical protein
LCLPSNNWAGFSLPNFAFSYKAPLCLTSDEVLRMGA